MTTGGIEPLSKINPNPWDNVKVTGRGKMEVPSAPSDLVNGYGLLVEQDL